MINLMLKSYNQVVQKFNVTSSVEIADKARLLEDNGEKISKLQTGDPFFNTPNIVRKDIAEIVLKKKIGYCDSSGIPLLKSSICEWYKSFTKNYLNVDNLFITAGAVNALQLVLNTLINSGDEVIIPEPSWPQYKNMVILARGSFKEISTIETNHKLDIKKLNKIITNKTKCLILTNPNNPTGITYKSAEIDELLKIAARNKIFIIFDEVYNRIVYNKNEFESVLQNKNYEKYKDFIIYINSFSKSLSMTGYRIGYTWIPEKIKPIFTKIIQNSNTCVNSYVQMGLAVSLKNYQLINKEITKMVKIYFKRHSELIQILIKKKIHFIKPHGAFYFLIENKEFNKSFVEELLTKHKIAVVPGSSYGENYKNFYRISYSADRYSYNNFKLYLKNNYD